jgi:hypothetical protein
MTSIYRNLAAISVSEHVEKKGRMDYLSWAWAWHYLKATYADANRTIYEDPTTGLNFFSDGKTAYVKVGITVGGLEHIDYLPIMDGRNNSIPLGKVTSTEVNKTIQRSTAKAIAMHGLGLSLWIGEDTSMMGLTDAPDETPDKAADEADAKAKAKAPTKAKTSKEVAKKPIEKIDLMVDDENWEKVTRYIAKNKDLGLRKIGANLRQKYNLSDPTKTALRDVFNAK